MASFLHQRIGTGWSAALNGLLIGCLSLLPGCQVYTAISDPKPEVPGLEDSAETEFSNATQRSSARERSASDRHKPWWRTFRDRDLNGLMDEALAQSPDLRAVGRRIDQASSRVVQAGSTLFPQLDASGEISRRWDDDGDRRDEASLGWILNWEIDAWGRIRSGRAAREGEREAAFEDWRFARLLLTAAVAEAWFELVEQRGQLKLAGEQIEANRTLLYLTRLRLGQGQGAAVDVLQQQEQLQSTLARVPDIEARIEALELVLDTLAGRMPGSRKRYSGNDRLQPPPAEPRSGYPSELLTERPDLRAQRARIVALDDEVAEAVADRFPRFFITGSQAGAGTPSIDRLVGDAVAGAIAPIFDAGRRRAEVANRQSRVKEEIDLYTQAFLVAVRDVEVALSTEAKLGERVRRQETQLDTARKLLTESRNRYILGATDYLPVIDAVSKVQDLERSLLSSQRERLSARIVLHRALGGPMPDPVAEAETEP